MSTKTRRGATRGAFTKAYNAIKTELAKDPKDKSAVKTFYNCLKVHQEKLAELDNEMDRELIAAATVTEDEYLAEIESVADYRAKFGEIEEIIRVMEQTDQDDISVGGSSSSFRTGRSDMKSMYRLPKLELVKFDGDPRQWLRFWSQFKGIDEDQNLAPEEKFQYLIQATKEKSEAREVIMSFPPTAANYPKAVSYLKERFGQDSLLVQIYVRDIMKLVLDNTLKREKISIAVLYDKLETQLRALESLGLTSDRYADMLFPWVESAIPEDSLRAWKRSHANGNQQGKDSLDGLMKFLKAEVESEVSIRLAQTGLGESRSTQKFKTEKKPTDVPTAAELFGGQQKPKKCIFCEKDHNSSECHSVSQMGLEDRKRILRDKKACMLCLGRGHFIKKCRLLRRLKCQFCGSESHHSLLCSGFSSHQKNPVGGGAEVGTSVDLNLASQCTAEVLLQTIIVRLKSENKSVLLRALIDSGCQQTFVTDKAAKILMLKSEGQVQRIHTLFGGQQTKVETHQKYKIRMESLDRSFNATFMALGKSTLCGTIPKIPEGPWFEELKAVGINIVDRREENKDIHLIIGSDIAGKLFTGRIHPTRSGPVAWETRMGWLLMGKTKPVDPVLDSTVTLLSLHVNDAEIQDLWRLDVLGINDPMESKSREELMESANQHFLANVKVNEEGRYEVALPWIEGHPPLPDYRDVAEKRLQAAVTKLKKDGKAELYQKLFGEWEENGIIEKMEVDESGHLGCYLPHRPVYNPKSTTTPIRPVFDASARKKGHPSLNDCLEKGPNLIELVPDVLMRFRRKQYGVVSDIKKAFLQITVRPEDRDYLKFLWWDQEKNEPVVYRHSRVVFGVSSSPFLLAATLNYHLDNAGEDHKKTAEKLKRSFYVDNCIASLDSSEEAEEFIVKSTQLMESGRFELHGWVSSGFQRDAVADSAPVVVSVLGLLWLPAKDSLKLDLRQVQDEMDGTVTKRKILSAAHRLFDPIGFSCPVTLIPKILLCDSWKLKLGWDQPVPEEMSKKFGVWKFQLNGLEEIEIPRWINDGASGQVTLHTFTDASKEAFAACVFARTESVYGVKIQLVTAKTRLAGKKGATIPRLELLGCLIGARLCHSVVGVFEEPEIPRFYWTDSSNALYWIKKNENWATFVYNRVTEINKLSSPSDWRHIPGENNPADLPSRGCTPAQLVDSRWWEGPAWLYKSPDEWPVSNINPDLEVVQAEKKKTVVVSQVASQGEIPWYLRSCLTYRRTVRAMAVIRRVVKRAKGPQEISREEELEAEIWLLKTVQQESFPVDQNLKSKLKATADENGILRVMTKITARQDQEYFLQPILMPYGHPLVKLLVLSQHLQHGHCGVQTLMTILREKFWIMKARKMVRQVVHSCVRCQRYRVKNIQPIEPPLPVERVRDCAVFEVTGIDLGGPLYLKEGQEQRKAWFVVFTCAVYRAVHLELVTSLSSEAFLECLRRFIARRGRPAIIYTDNGTNFEGVSNALNRVNWEQVAMRESVQKIDWRFNPPSAPWWGGWWERLVGLVKKILRRVLGRACVSYESMATILCDCEDVINSRPLGYVSEDPDDLTPLTPNTFLREIKTSGVADLDQVELCDFQHKVQRRAILREDLRKRFRKEYLAHLVLRNKKCGSREIHEGDLVYIGSEDKKRIDWPLARVMKIFPGRDGVVRVARLKTAKGELDRPVQRLYPLELAPEQTVTVPVESTEEERVEDVEESIIVEPQTEEPKVLPIVTRSGRVVQKPARFLV